MKTAKIQLKGKELLSCVHVVCNGCGTPHQIHQADEHVPIPDQCPTCNRMSIINNLWWEVAWVPEGCVAIGGEHEE